MKKQTPKGKPSIRENAYGNWYGYLGTRKVEMFFGSPEETQEQAAKRWLAEQQEAQGIIAIEPKYKVMQDEVDPTLYRVAYASSEYTVQFNKQWQHGLTKEEAKKMVKFLEDKRIDAINRLSDALTEFRNRFGKGKGSPSEQEAFCRELQAKHRIDIKSIKAGLMAEAGTLKM